MTRDSGPLCDEPEDDLDAGEPEPAPAPNQIDILAVPGLAKQTPEFISRLAALAVRNGWDPTGIAAVISHESGFHPEARSPNSTATGLIQFIEATAHALGTTTAALATMSAVAQLPFVEKYFKRFMPQIPDRPEDYILVTYGRPDVVGFPDDYVLDRRDSEDPHERARYAANTALDHDGKGSITVGDLRGSLMHTLNAAHGAYIRTLPWTSSSGAAGGAAAIALIATIVIFGPDIARAVREVLR
jgi:transglycosylase-like protein with SLT domain